MSTVHSPAYPPSLADWEDIKPVIKQLYIREGKRLTELQRILCEKYRFRASHRTYKTKLRTWGMRKNYRAGISQSTPPGVLLDPGTASLTTFDTEFSQQSDATESDRSSSSQRGTNTPGKEGLTEDRSSPESQAVVRSHHASQSPPTPLLLETVDVATESVVLAARAFVDSISSNEDLSSPVWILNHAHPFRRRKNYIWNQFQRGLTMLEQGEVQDAFHSLQAGCASAETFFAKPPIQALTSMLMIMGNYRWTRHPTAWRAVLTFLHSMAGQTLGSSHPLTHVLDKVRVWDVMHRAARPSVAAVLDLRQQCLGPADAEVLQLKQGLCVGLAREGDHDRSEQVIQQAYEASVALHGPHNILTRQCLRRLGNLYLERHRWDEAERAFEQAVSLDEGASPVSPGRRRPAADEISIFTCQNLSFATFRKYDLPRSEYWAAQELELALDVYGPDDDYTLDCLHRKAARESGEPPEKWFSWLEVS